MVNDISRALFHARAKGDVHVQLPKEDMEIGDERKCGKLRYSMYGTRGAAQHWYHECSNQLIKIGLLHGKASPRVLCHLGEGMRTYVHGDDYVSIGKHEALKWMKLPFGK